MNSLFEKLDTYLTQKEIKDVEFCYHRETTTENDVISCSECGEQIQKIIMHEKEWRFYDKSSNPGRVQIRKGEDLSIAKDVKNMEFSKFLTW